MARPRATRECSDPACLHAATPRLRERQPTLGSIEPDGGRVLLEERRIVGAESPDLDASRGVLTDCVLERCDLANASFRRARLGRVAFVDCRLVGADFGDAAQLDDVTFTGCLLDMASFDAAHLARVAFVRSRLVSASFAAARLARVAFPGSDLSRCDFAGALAEGGAGSIDLRGATLSGVSLDPRLLRAIAIRPEDAPQIARALGMTVADGEARTSCKE